MNEECCDREVYSILFIIKQKSIWNDCMCVCKYEVIRTKTLIESNAFLNDEYYRVWFHPPFIKRDWVMINDDWFSSIVNWNSILIYL